MIATWDGLPVVENPALPIFPSPGEDARRIVRHGMADILRWLGEEIGPKPGEVVSCLVIDGRMHVSPIVARQLAQRVEEYVPRRAPAPAAPAPVVPETPAWLRKAMCEKKRRYPTREKAVSVAAGRVGKRRGKAPLLRAYACPLCDGWHLTHKPKRSEP